MFFNTVNLIKRCQEAGLNPFRAGRCLSTLNPMTGRAEEVPSQSLSSRAMSFDIKVGTTSETTNVSIPFEQGDVFRRLQMRQVRWQYLVSIPFEQGDVFRQERAVEVHTGYQSQSLSSRAMSFDTCRF